MRMPGIQIVYSRGAVIGIDCIQWLFCGHIQTTRSS